MTGTTDIVALLANFEGSDELGNGDFSVCRNGAAIITELYEALDQLLHALHPATQRIAAIKARAVLAKFQGLQP